MADIARDPNVIVEVRGGVAEIQLMTPDTVVEVRDFDVEGVDESNLTDINGELCRVSIHEVSDMSGFTEPDKDGGDRNIRALLPSVKQKHALVFEIMKTIIVASGNSPPSAPHLVYKAFQYADEYIRRCQADLK